MVAQVFKCLSKVRLAFTTWRAETVASALKKVIEMSAENKSVFYSDLQWSVTIFHYFKLRKFFIAKKCLLIITEAGGYSGRSQKSNTQTTVKSSGRGPGPGRLHYASIANSLIFMLNVRSLD